MTAIIRVINPNSNKHVTGEMSKTLDTLRRSGAPRLECLTLEQGPRGIESQADVSKVEPMLAQLIQSDSSAAAFIIGCYSDPGLALCREITDRPVFGIAECAIATALTRGSSFGVISILENSVKRHIRHLRERLLHHRCAGDRPLGLTIAQIQSGGKTLDRMKKIGTILRDEDGADVIIMGCAGMAKYRINLEKFLSVPVIDPTQAAASIAIGVVALMN